MKKYGRASIVCSFYFFILFPFENDGSLNALKSFKFKNNLPLMYPERFAKKNIFVTLKRNILPQILRFLI